MIAVIGIMGCIYAVAIGAVIAVGAIVTSTVVSVEQKNAMEDAANKQRQQQDAANLKAENRAKGLAALQSRTNASNELKTQQAVGGAVLLQQLLSDDENKKANRLRAENGLTSTSGKPDYSYGSPSKVIQTQAKP